MCACINCTRARAGSTQALACACMAWQRRGAGTRAGLTLAGSCQIASREDKQELVHVQFSNMVVSYNNLAKSMAAVRLSWPIQDKVVSEFEISLETMKEVEGLLTAEFCEGLVEEGDNVKVKMFLTYIHSGNTQWNRRRRLSCFGPGWQQI